MAKDFLTDAEMAAAAPDFISDSEAPDFIPDAPAEQGLIQRAIADVRATDFGEAAKAGLQSIGSLGARVQALAPSIRLGSGPTISENLAAMQVQEPTTTTGQLVKRFTQEIPADIAAGVAIASAPIALPAIGAAALIAGGGQAAGTLFRQAQEERLDATEVLKDSLLAATFGGVLASIPKAYRTIKGSAAKKAAGEALPSVEVSITKTPAQVEIESQLQKSIEDSARLGKAAEKEKSVIRKALGGVQEVKAKEVSLVDDLSQRAAEIEGTSTAKIEDLQARLAIEQDPVRLSTNPKIVDKLTKQIETLKASQTEQLSKITARLGIEQARLQSQRSTLLEKVRSGFAPDAELASISKKLQQNLQDQISIQDTMKEFGFTFKTGKIGSGLGVQRTKEEIISIAQEQVAKVNKALEAGHISESAAEQLRSLEFREALRVQGVDPANLQIKPSFFGKALNNTTRFNVIQKQTGARTGEVFESAVQATNQRVNLKLQELPKAAELAKKLNALGHTNEDILRTLQYYETTPEGLIQFNPNAAKIVDDSGKVKLDVGPYEGIPISPEADQLFQQARSQYNMLGDAAGVPRIQRYIPLRENLPGGQKASSKGITNTTLAQERTDGKLLPGIHDTDYLKVTARYIDEVGRHKYLAPVIQDGSSAYNALLLQGNRQVAEEFKKNLFESIGVNTEKEAAQLFGDSIVKLSQADLAKLVNALPDPDKGWEEIYKAATSAMYSNLVGTNPGTLMAQAIQPEVLLTTEIGLKGVARGRSALVARSAPAKALKERAEKLLKLSLTDDLSLLDQALSTTNDSALAKGLTFINRPSAAISKRFMGGGERVNRLTSLLGSMHTFDEALAKGGLAGVDALMSGITTSERAFVRSAQQKGGIEAAKDAFALIVTRRANFAYSLADKPELLRSGVGALLPFTTFSRNIINRYAEDVAERNFSKLASRVMTPIVGATLFASLTGKIIPGGTPTESALSVSQLTPVPFVARPAQLIAQGKPGKAAEELAKQLTPYGPIKRIAEIATGKRAVLKPIKELTLRNIVLGPPRK